MRTPLEESQTITRNVQYTNLPVIKQRVGIKQIAKYLLGVDESRTTGIHRIYIPCVQRDYVWKQPAIKQFFKSIYEGKYRGPGEYVTLSTIVDNQSIKCRKVGEVNLEDVVNATILIDSQQRCGAIIQCLYGIPCSTAEGKLTAHFLLFNPVTEQFTIDNRQIVKKLQISMRDFWNEDPEDTRQAINDYMERNENHFRNPEDKAKAERNLFKLKDALENFEFTVSNEYQGLEEAFELFYNINFYQMKVNSDTHYNAIFFMLDPETTDKLRHFYTDQSHRGRRFIPEKKLTHNIINLLCHLTYDTNPKKFIRAREEEDLSIKDKFKRSVDQYCNYSSWDHYLSFFEFCGSHSPYNKTKVHYGYGLYLLGKRKGLNPQRLDRYIREWLELILLYNRYPKKRTLDKDMNKYYIRNGEFTLEGLKRFISESVELVEKNLENITENHDLRHSDTDLEKIYQIYLNLNHDARREDISNQEKFEYCWNSFKQRHNHFTQVV